MRVNDLYSFDNSNISSTLKVDDALGSAGVNAGDILEGIVTGVDKKTHVTFEQLNKREITFENSAVKNAYVGEKRRFEVVSANADKLVLRDLGGVGAEVEARAMMAAQVDFGMPKMVNDFEETMGTKEEEDTDSIRNLSDDDYSELAAEGFSIEDYKADRLVRALDRIKGNRAARKESIKAQSEELMTEQKNIKRRAQKAAADKYAAHAGIIDALVDADLPVTDENIEGILGAIAMSGEAQRMTANSYAYLIGKEMAPTVSNVYRSVYSGSIRRMEITPEDWAGLRPAADEIVNEANSQLGSPKVSIRDARWLVEYDIPITADNLIYKCELEDLTSAGIAPDEVARAAAAAIQRGGEAKDAIMIASREPSGGNRKYNGSSPIEQLLGRLNLQRIRLEMATAGTTVAKVSGLATDVEAIQQNITELQGLIRDYFEQLAREFDIEGYGSAAAVNPVDLAIETSLAVDEIGSAPVTLYGAVFTARASITLGDMAGEAGKLTGQVAAARATVSYEASATQIRADLGDSMGKAFGNIDSLLADIDMEATDANIRAVKILGYNSMEITADNVENMKFFDSKVTSMVEAMKPAVVMAMIKRGYNPLGQDIDAINREIAEIEAEEGVLPEERFSSFLVKLERTDEITGGMRDAYIGIYRLLYQIEKSDGAAIGAAVNSGRSLTLENLLTESRTRQSRGVDESLGDGTDVVNTAFTNSITDQIRNAFNEIQHERLEYSLRLARSAAKVTAPAAWKEALDGLVEEVGEASQDAETVPELTLEQLAERLTRADATVTDGAIEAAAKNIRNTMASGGAAKRFLRSIGADDSVRNINLMESEAGDLTLDLGSGEQLLETIGSEETLTAAFEQAETLSRQRLEDGLAFGTDIRAVASALTQEADRFGLLKHLAGRQHYRMSIGTDNPARINLTIVRNEERAGSMSLEVSTRTYHVRADLRVMAADEPEQGTVNNPVQLLGRITCDSTSELADMNQSMEGFIGAVEKLGFDASQITSGVDRLSPDMYLSRLGEMKQRADITSQDGNPRRRTATSELYRVARMFVEAFI